MSDHNAQAIIITCIDFRFQEYITKWIEDHFEEKTYDRVAFAGGVYDLETILKQVSIADRLHHIKKVVFINHEDCGAYGEEGTYDRHAHDLEQAGKEVKEKFPNLGVETYYLHLDGIFEQISNTIPSQTTQN